MHGTQYVVDRRRRGCFVGDRRCCSIARGGRSRARLSNRRQRRVDVEPEFLAREWIARKCQTLACEWRVECLPVETDARRVEASDVRKQLGVVVVATLEARRDHDVPLTRGARDEGQQRRMRADLDQHVRALSDRGLEAIPEPDGIANLLRPVVGVD